MSGTSAGVPYAYCPAALDPGREARPQRFPPGGELSAIGCPVRLRHARGGALATYALAERTARLTPGAVLSGQDDPDRVPTPATGAAVPHFLAGD